MDALVRAASALNERHAIAGRLSFDTMFGGIVVNLHDEGAGAVVALYGAQVLSYRAKDCGEVLWLSPQAQLGTGKAVRGGIPVCWPWFGPHPDGAGRPAHGFVRTRPWKVLGTVEGPGSVGVVFSLERKELQCADWRHDVGVQVEVHLGKSLCVRMATSNFSDTPLSLTQALHTYLRVGDIEQVKINGLQGKPFIDQLDPGALKREETTLQITQEIDRIYQDITGPVSLTDLSLGRRIVVDKTCSSSSVVWNPWVEKSARLGDMGEDGYRQMLCIETANAGSDVVTVQPHEAYRLETTITVEQSDPQ